VTGEAANNVGGIHHYLCATTIARSHSWGGMRGAGSRERKRISSLVLREWRGIVSWACIIHLYFLQRRAVYHTTHRLPRRSIVTGLSSTSCVWGMRVPRLLWIGRGGVRVPHMHPRNVSKRQPCHRFGHFLAREDRTVGFEDVVFSRNEHLKRGSILSTSQMRRRKKVILKR